MLLQCTALARPPCGPGQCLNTEGGYGCLCPAGYSNSNNTCTDIDEVGSGRIFIKLELGTVYTRVIQMKVPPICKQKLVKNN